MNEVLIENWNNTVSNNDIVFHLGDFCFGGSKLWNDVLNRLNGKIYLILGNHDIKQIRQGYKSRFENISMQMSIKIEDKSILMNHYPFLCFAGSYNKENIPYILNGHVHTSKICNTGKDFDRLSNMLPMQYDVGVDLNNYKPISFLELDEKIKTQIENNKNLLMWIK